MSKTAAGIGAILSLSVIALAGYLWWSLGDVEMGLAGYLALAGGGLATLALGGGLFALLLYSHRAGFDEAAGKPFERPPGRMEKPPQNR